MTQTCYSGLLQMPLAKNGHNPHIQLNPKNIRNAYSISTYEGVRLLEIISLFKRESMDKLQAFDLHFQNSPGREGTAGELSLSLPKQEIPEDEHIALKREANDDEYLPLQHGHREQDGHGNSLALLTRNSIEHGLPIPRNMLSHSEDAYQPQEEDPDKELYFNRIKVEVSEEDKEWFVESLGLNELLLLRKFPNNTKNVLRNFGNAQNQYVLYHADAKEYVRQHLMNPEKFFDWVRTLKLERFQNFKKVWAEESNRAFRRIYKQLCLKFYRECSIPYVLSSRMKNGETKLSHLRYIYRFLQGLKDPYEFTYFKKIER